MADPTDAVEVTSEAHGGLSYERVRFERPLGEPVNVFRIGRVVLDSGHPSQPTLEWFSARAAEIDRVLLTHAHIDHVGASVSLPALAETPHTVLEGVPAQLSRLEQTYATLSERVAADGGDEQEQSVASELGTTSPFQDVTVSRVVAPDEQISIGDGSLDVVHTPGHEERHASFHEPDSGVVFVGDGVSPDARFGVGVYESSIRGYLDTLDRLAALEPTVLVPSHGEPITSPAAHIAECRRQVTALADDIARHVEQSDPAGITLESVVDSVFSPDGGFSSWYFRRLAETYLSYLVADGRLDERAERYVPA